jgi:PhnB protein
MRRNIFACLLLVLAAAARGADAPNEDGNLPGTPPGYHSLTPYLYFDDCAGAIEFYKKVFGAKEKFRVETDGNKIEHAQLTIGDSVLMLQDEVANEQLQSPKTLHGKASSMIYLYVGNVDAIAKEAVKAGAKLKSEPTDMDWGDRVAVIVDPFGHTWWIATTKTAPVGADPNDGGL